MAFTDYNTDPGIWLRKYEMTGAETGAAVRIPSACNKEYSVWGTWGSATLAIQGSYDPADPPANDSWVSLKKLDTLAAIAETANAAGIVLESPVWIRPKTTGGTGSALFVVLKGEVKK